MSIMLRAVSTSKAVRGCFGALGMVAVACGGADSAVAPPSSSGGSPRLTIDVRYLSALTDQQKLIVRAAADRWTHALLTDLGSFSLDFARNDCFPGEPAVNEIHRNLLLFFSVGPIDGPHGALGYTQVCAQSIQDLPIVSHIRIDAADIDSAEMKGLLASVVMHEMGHALGFNPEVWARKGLVGGGAVDPYFAGTSAKTEFARRLPSYTGNAVPLEDMDQSGSPSSHWRWTVFGDELMVGALVPGYRYPLSAVTLGLFSDIGYAVDMSSAEPYPLLSIVSAEPNPVRVMLDGDVVAPRITRRLRPLVLH